MRVVVNVDVLDKDATTGARATERHSTRSNRMIFIFAQRGEEGEKEEEEKGQKGQKEQKWELKLERPALREIVPDTYGEILMHVEAERRWQEEGPWAEDLSREMLSPVPCVPS